MTGFAAVSREDEAGAVSVTIRALNHRYLDLQLRLPPSAAAIEPRLRTLVQQRIARGRVELSVSVQGQRTSTVEITLNEEFTTALEAALAAARERGLITGALSPGDLVRLPQALITRERPIEPDVAAALDA
ncbi:MAG TPA: YicC/YloC family endoribonuclease, partial [Vicinamibacterales bacterium]